MTEKKPAANKGFAIAGVVCFAESLVLGGSVVLRIKFGAKNPRHRKPSERQTVQKLLDNFIH
jgi:hypothetical protein